MPSVGKDRKCSLPFARRDSYKLAAESFEAHLTYTRTLSLTHMFTLAHQKHLLTHRHTTG